MELKQQTIKELKKIIATDYGVTLNDEQLAELGEALLRLTRLSTAALARVEMNITIHSGKGGNSFESNTNKE